MTESLFRHTEKPRLLDLFCGAGGAGTGYERAGFEVIGVDIEPQPHYPFRFVRADALEFMADPKVTGIGLDCWNFDAIHASPPCQHFTAYRRRPDHVAESPNLIPLTRELLEASGLLYVIENVPQARTWLHEPITLCGSSFGLDVRRHRLFEANWPLEPPACDHAAQVAKGKRFPGATNRDGRYTAEIGVWRIPLDVQRAAMGIDWMELEELSEAIPPAYTEHIGRELFQLLRQEEDAVVAA